MIGALVGIVVAVIVGWEIGVELDWNTFSMKRRVMVTILCICTLTHCLELFVVGIVELLS